MNKEKDSVVKDIPPLPKKKPDKKAVRRWENEGGNPLPLPDNDENDQRKDDKEKQSE